MNSRRVPVEGSAQWRSRPLCQFLAAAALVAVPLADLSAQDVPLVDAAADRFVRKARVVAMRGVGSGTNRPRQAVLRLGRETRRAIWKTVGSDDPYNRAAGSESYRHEVAACELDRALGLGLVPATAERRVRDRTGSLQLWVEGAEEVRTPDPKTLGPDAQARLADIRLFRMLIHAAPDTNVLLAPSGELFSIDHAGAFSTEEEIAGSSMGRLRRSTFDAIAAMDASATKKAVGRWLEDDELAALLKRRLEIVGRTRARVEQRGESSVFLP